VTVTKFSGEKLAGMDAGVNNSLGFCFAKPTAEKQHGCCFSAAQGIDNQKPTVFGSRKYRKPRRG
jgi:hypothetical protein